MVLSTLDSGADINSVIIRADRGVGGRGGQVGGVDYPQQGLRILHSSN